MPGPGQGTASSDASADFHDNDLLVQHIRHRSSQHKPLWHAIPHMASVAMLTTARAYCSTGRANILHRPNKYAPADRATIAVTAKQACRRRAGGGDPHGETRGSPGRVSLPRGDRCGIPNAAAGLARPTNAGDCFVVTVRGRCRAAQPSRAGARRPPAGRSSDGSTNVCSNQEDFTAGLYMCSNYLHVPGNPWPLAKIR
jgi:hypothetical protein